MSENERYEVEMGTLEVTKDFLLWIPKEGGETIKISWSNFDEEMRNFSKRSPSINEMKVPEVTFEKTFQINHTSTAERG